MSACFSQTAREPRLSAGPSRRSDSRITKETNLGHHHPLNNRIWWVAQKRFLSQDELLEAVQKTRLILLGEKHDNRRHHEIQALLLRGLVDRHRRPAVVWEMITNEEQEALATFLRKSPRDAKRLGAAIRWNERGWPEWSAYQPIAEIAMKAGLTFVPAGISRRALMQRFHGPTTTKSKTKVLPLPDSARADLERMLEAAHCGQANKQMLAMMIQAQEQRDHHMAHQLISSNKLHDGAVLIAGTEHVRQDRGAPFQLRGMVKSDPPTTVAVGLLEIEHPKNDPRQYIEKHKTDQPQPFDYLWFTPRVDNIDPCTKFKKKLQQMHKK